VAQRSRNGLACVTHRRFSLPPAVTDGWRCETETTMNVCDLKPGAKGRVTHIDGNGPIRQRLLDMGILPDILIELKRVSPTGDPLWITCEGTQLSLRRQEAASIHIANESFF
jgi:ferrous iron transport protein A